MSFIRASFVFVNISVTIRVNAIGAPLSIHYCMNPNENDFTRDEPLPAQQFQPQEDIGPTGREQFRRAKEEVSTQMSQTWDQTKEKANLALEGPKISCAKIPCRLFSAHSALESPLAWPSATPLPANANAKSSDGVSVGEIQLERSFAAVSLAAVQIGPGKIERRYAKRRQTVEKNGRREYAKPSGNAGKRGRAERNHIQNADHKPETPG